MIIIAVCFGLSVIASAAVTAAGALLLWALAERVVVKQEA